MKGFSARCICPAVLTVLVLLLVLSVLPAMAQDEVVGAPVVSFPIGGTVGETFEAGVFTYLKIDAPGSAPIWVVTEVCSVKRNDKIQVTEGKIYPQVYSSATGLTFDNLVVATKILLNGADVKAFDAHQLPAGCTIGRPAKK